MLAIYIRLLGHSLMRPYTLGAKTPLFSGVSLGKIQTWPHLVLSRVQFTSFLLVVTLNINTRCLQTPQVILPLHSHRIPLPHKRNARCSTYLQRIYSRLPTMGMSIAWQFLLLRTRGRMTSSTRTHARPYTLSQEVGMNPSRSVVAPPPCYASLTGGIVVELLFSLTGTAIHLRV